MYVEIILSKRAHTHTHTHTHTHRHPPTQSEHTDYTKLNLHNLKRAANRDFRNGKRGTERKTWKVYSFAEKMF